MLRLNTPTHDRPLGAEIANAESHAERARKARDAKGDQLVAKKFGCTPEELVEKLGQLDPEPFDDCSAPYETLGAPQTGCAPVDAFLKSHWQNGGGM